MLVCLLVNFLTQEYTKTNRRVDMKNTYNFEQFCPKENKNILINAEINDQGNSEFFCSHSTNCVDNCNCISKLSESLNKK